METPPAKSMTTASQKSIRRPSGAHAFQTARCFRFLNVRPAVISAVIPAKAGGDGWESNPPRTPRQRPANGFEDRGRHQPPYIPSRSDAIRLGGCRHLQL